MEHAGQHRMDAMLLQETFSDVAELAIAQEQLAGARETLITRGNLQHSMSAQFSLVCGKERKDALHKEAVKPK